MKPRIFTPHPYQKMISDHILDVPDRNELIGEMK